MKNLLLISMAFCASNIMAQAPTDAPTVPFANEADVVSIYSEAYANVETNDWNPNWGQGATLAFETIAGNEVAAYTNLDFTGIEPTATIDISDYSHFNVSYWTEADKFAVKLVDFGADGAWSGGDDVEHELSFTPETGWNYLSIPISDFSGMTTTEHFAQLLFVSSGAGANVYVDDIYFSKEAGTTSINEHVGFRINAYPNPATEQITIQYPGMYQIAIANVLGQKVMKQHFQSTESKTIELSSLENGLYFITIETNSGTVSSKFLKK